MGADVRVMSAKRSETDPMRSRQPSSSIRLIAAIVAAFVVVDAMAMLVSVHPGTVETLVALANSGVAASLLMALAGD
ncbi:MAG: hypothetical protein ACYDGR_09870 [Candidatus Dormibacteria bacterium]